MPVELTILTGAREGECIVLDADAFRVGDDPASEIYFDPGQNPAGRGRLALVVREESGWRIQNLGRGRLVVNHTVVDARTPLRSGDVIRLSNMGPDILFKLVNTPRTGTATASTYVESPEALSDATAVEVDVAPRADSHKFSLRRYTAATVVAALMAFVLLTSGLFFDAQDDTSPVPQSEVAKDSRDRDTMMVRDQFDGLHPSIEDPRSSVTGTDHSKLVAGNVAAAVCMLVVETPDQDRTFPLGTACAIHKNVLLTNAVVATELQAKRLRGWAISAFWPDDGQQLSVSKILVHRGFNDTADSPNERIYWEVAILRLDGERKAILALAESAELAELEEGFPLVCAGIPHSGLRRTRFDNPKVDQYPAEVYLRTRLPIDGSTPFSEFTLLHLAATLPKNLYGSPVVNAAGHVVGVYAEKALLMGTDDKPALELHYAPLITLAHAYLAGQTLDYWIEPECPDNENPTAHRP